MGLGLVSYALGDASWAWAELVEGQAPTVPSWADLGSSRWCRSPSPGTSADSPPARP